MRFDDPSKPDPYLNTRDQWRLLRLVFLMCVIMVAVMWAARPETWYWLIPPGNETASNTEAPEQSPPPQWDSPVNTAENDAPAFGAARSTTPGKSGSSAVEIPAEWLAEVSDNELGLKASEAEAYYRVLAHVSRLDEGLLGQSGRKDVLHTNLIHDPSLYRGQLVSVQGTARRIQPIDVNKNEFGVKQAYEVWFYTNDSGNDPWRVVTTHLDSRLPIGEQVSVPITVTGYFFKQYSYASQGGVHVAPLLLAADVEPYVVKKVAPSGTGLEPYIVALAAVVGFGAMLASLIYRRGDRRFKRQLAEQFPVEDAASRKVLDEMKLSKTDTNPF